MRRSRVHRSLRRRTGSSPRGFTLAEIVVVAIVLAIIGAMVVPRLAASTRTKSQLATEQVTALLAMYAFRDSLATQPVSLLRDPDTGSLEVWVLDTDPSQPDQPPSWRPDRFCQPVILPQGIVLAEVVIDNRPLQPDDWQVRSSPGYDHHRIELRLLGDDQDVSVILEPYTNTPYQVVNGEVKGAPRLGYDLDAAGREREVW